MEPSLKWSRFLLAALTVFALSSGHTTEVSDRFAPIANFKDDRYATTVNDNFRRITQVFVADGDFNVAVTGTSTVIRFSNAQTDNDYGIFVQGAFASTMTAVLDKTKESFKIEYSVPVGSARLDWILVR